MLQHQHECAKHCGLVAELLADGAAGQQDRDARREVEPDQQADIREAMTNIIRHAKASHCEIALFTDSEHACMRISDNGSAGKTNKVLQKGNGLTGMTERIQALGGELRMHVEQGLTLELRLPI